MSDEIDGSNMPVVNPHEPNTIECVIYKLEQLIRKAENELARKQRLGVQEDEVCLRMQLDAAKAREAKLREALDRARAAVWDSHYGHGICVDYARNVDREIKEALEGK